MIKPRLQVRHDYAGAPVLAEAPKPRLFLRVNASSVDDDLLKRAQKLYSVFNRPGPLLSAFNSEARIVDVADHRRQGAVRENQMFSCARYAIEKRGSVRDLRMSNRYAHLSAAHLGTAVNRLDAVFGAELAKMPSLQAAPESDHAVITLVVKNLYKQVQASAS